MGYLVCSVLCHCSISVRSTQNSVPAHWGGLEVRLESAEQFKKKSCKCRGGEADGAVPMSCAWQDQEYNVEHCAAGPRALDAVQSCETVEGYQEESKAWRAL